MPVPASSLSVAVQGVAEFLDSQFGEDVNIIVAHPQRASEIAKGAATGAHCLNLFTYRVAPSGFHADAGIGDSHFIRINALLTPFPSEAETEAEDSDLRILGHAIRVLQSHPVLPIATEPPLPGGAITEPPGRKDYRLEAIMLAPPMEELNHIWTTQGGELAYRLSVAYEFALIPIEPLEPRIIADPPRTLMIGVRPNMDDRFLDYIPPNGESRGIALGDGENPPPVSWTPVWMFSGEDALTNALEVADDAIEADVVISGLPGEEVALQVVWTLDDETTAAQAAQIITLAAPHIEHPDAAATLTLAIPANAASGVATARPASGGAAVPDSSSSNALTMNVTGGGP